MLHGPVTLFVIRASSALRRETEVLHGPVTLFVVIRASSALRRETEAASGVAASL